MANISPKEFYSLVLGEDPSRAYRSLSSIPREFRQSYVSFRNEEGEKSLRGQTALHAAARAGHSLLVQLLLGSNSDKDAQKADGATPISIAAQNGHLHVVELLLALGAEKDAAMNDSSTPLFAASQNGHFHVAVLLLAAGADQNAANNKGTTPIFIAAQCGHERMVELLLAAGASNNAAMKDGATPLYIASQNGYDKVVELLLASGAHNNAALHGKWTPYDIAKQQSHTRIVELLSSPLPQSTIDRYHSRQGQLVSHLTDTRSAFRRFKNEAPFRTILDKFQISSSSRNLLFLTHGLNSTTLKYLTIDLLKDAVKDNIPPVPTLKLIALFEELQAFSLSLALQPSLPSALANFPPLTNLLIPPENLKIEPASFAKGADGMVYRAVYLGISVAVKRLTNSNASFRNELEKWCQFRHPNILLLIGFSEPSNSLPLIVMELMDQSLYHLLNNHKIDLSWDSRLKMAHGIAAGLAYLHEIRNIIHRDIKSLNILVKGRDYEVKIADFGASRGNTSLVSRPAGTPCWLAPELYDSYLPTFSVDIYAFGITLNELSTRKPPYEEIVDSDMAIMKAVTSNQRPKMEPFPSASSLPFWHPLFVELIQKCWDQDPSQRPSASLVLQEITQMLVEPIPTSSSSSTSYRSSSSAAQPQLVFDYYAYASHDFAIILPTSSSSEVGAMLPTSFPSPVGWTIRSWLSSIGISDDIIRMFEANDLDDREDIQGLSEQDLKDLGILSMGIRKKILRYIPQLNSKQ